MKKFDLNLNVYSERGEFTAERAFCENSWPILAVKIVPS